MYEATGGLCTWRLGNTRGICKTRRANEARSSGDTRRQAQITAVEVLKGFPGAWVPRAEGSFETEKLHGREHVEKSRADCNFARKPNLKRRTTTEGRMRPRLISDEEIAFDRERSPLYMDSEEIKQKKQTLNEAG